MASTYLQRTPSATGDRQKATISFWHKRSSTSDYYLFTASPDASTTSAFLFSFVSGGLDMRHWTSNSNDFTITTNRLFRDTSAWYHIVLVIDTTQATSSDRIKMYVNGVQETSFSTASYPSQNLNLYINQASTKELIGVRSDETDGYLDGSLAHFHKIDGTAYDADDFGETDSTTGIWKPKTAPSVTYGTNGFFLKFENSGAFGTDSSGNSNTFTVNGTMTQTLDTPSNVFATWNSIFGTGRQDQLSYTNGNTTVTSSATSGSDTTAVSTLGFTQGKYYAEFKLTSDADGAYIGVMQSDFNLTNSGVDTSGQSAIWIVRGDDGTKRNNGSASYFGSAFSNNDIIQIAIDMDNNKIWWGKNGTYPNSGDPAAGTNAAYTNLSGELLIIAGDNYSTKTPTIQANFGNGYFGTTQVSSAQNPDDGIGIFEYDVPTGYRALCTESINAEEYD